MALSRPTGTCVHLAPGLFFVSYTASLPQRLAFPLASFTKPNRTAHKHPHTPESMAYTLALRSTRSRSIDFISISDL